MSFPELKNDIIALLKEKNCGPILIRLSWHDAGTYCKHSKTGGPRGAQRFEDGESKWGANAGLQIARNLLAPIKEKHPDICNADLWAFAAVVSIEYMGGPHINFSAGRTDIPDSSHCVTDGRLPDGDKKVDHLRDIFYRMGFNDREIVALSGAHTVGFCHADRSGFEGPWTDHPHTFDNAYFKDMLTKKWEKTTASTGNPQFKSGETMMLISDLALLEDKSTEPVVKQFAEDQDAFFAEFASAFEKLQNLGYEGLTRVEY